LGAPVEDIGTRGCWWVLESLRLVICGGGPSERETVDSVNVLGRPRDKCEGVRGEEDGVLCAQR